ncbi:hypothetical protein, partial [Pseudomonas syringae group genomosp. 7]|uniref:hypothetical protein n=1 Tax=Pseudomonas syringae group genomosp. 7 TaxID=251699 RepID=UPI00376FE1F3
FNFRSSFPNTFFRLWGFFLLVVLFVFCWVCGFCVLFFGLGCGGVWGVGFGGWWWWVFGGCCVGVRVCGGCGVEGVDVW